MKLHEIKTPEQIQDLLTDLDIPAKEKKKLTKELANDTRNFFRKQIRSQRDIHDIPYAPRRRRKPLYVLNGRKVYRQNLDKRRNMLTGLSRMLVTQFDESGFSVGLAGVAGIVAKVHNQGETVDFTTRINSWFNTKTNRFEGGRKAHLSYRMPERTFIGWTKKLEQQIATKILQRMEFKD